LNLKLLLPTYRARERFVVAALRSLRGLGPGGSPPRVLDVGCGEADLHGVLHPLCSVLSGCDVNAGDVQRARRTASGARQDQYRIADGAELPWDNEVFDVVLCLETVEHVADVDGLLAEAARVLRPGGALVLTCPNVNFPITYDPLHWLAGRRLLAGGAYAYGHTWLPSEAEMYAALRGAGFVDLSVAGLTGWLPAALEAYWAGWAQRIVKQNARNDAGAAPLQAPSPAITGRRTPAAGPAAPQRAASVGLAFVSRKP
jgi:SAM-dependent methyltransferase